MDKLHYQQFSMSYGTYDDNGNIQRVLNGVGNSYNAVSNVLKEEKSPFFDFDNVQVKEEYAIPSVMRTRAPTSPALTPVSLWTAR